MRSLACSKVWQKPTFGIVSETISVGAITFCIVIMATQLHYSVIPVSLILTKFQGLSGTGKVKRKLCFIDKLSFRFKLCMAATCMAVIMNMV